MSGTRDIWYWRYELISRNPLNSVSERTRHEGALIRVGEGYGCVHPWPELGDLTLGEELKRLRDGEPTAQLGRSALVCAENDAMFRDRRINCLDELREAIPPSHWFYQIGDDPQTVASTGFQSVKFKVGKDPGRERKVIEEWAASTELTIRLDANESFGLSDFQAWWRELSEGLKKRIEMVEDPIPWKSSDWRCLRENGIPLAADRQAEKRLKGSDFAVWKPSANWKAGENLIDWTEREAKRLVITSYMDHPVGQMFATREAALAKRRLAGRLGHCGLLTHSCFEPNEFSERLVVKDAKLLPGEGTGLGFDDLLEKLPWKRLT